MLIITLERLQRALNHVTAELEDYGFWTEKVSDIGVELGWIAYCHGFFSNKIVVPAISASRLLERYWPGYCRSSLRGVLRHEFAHGVDHYHSDLLRRMRFRSVFCGGEYDETKYVSEYASTSVGEDFAESAATFLKFSGDPPRRYTRHRVIARKLNFVRRIGQRLDNR